MIRSACKAHHALCSLPKISKFGMDGGFYKLIYDMHNLLLGLKHSHNCNKISCIRHAQMLRGKLRSSLRRVWRRRHGGGGATEGCADGAGAAAGAVAGVARDSSLARQPRAPAGAPGRPRAALAPPAAVCLAFPHPHPRPPPRSRYGRSPFCHPCTGCVKFWKCNQLHPQSLLSLCGLGWLSLSSVKTVKKGGHIHVASE